MNCSPKNNVILCAPAGLLATMGGGQHGLGKELLAALPAGAHARADAAAGLESAAASRAGSSAEVGEADGAQGPVDPAAPEGSGSAEWYPSIGQRVWVRGTAAAGEDDDEWAAVVVGNDGMRWRVAPEADSDGDAGRGPCWWPRFEAAVLRRERDVADAAEALSKREGIAGGLLDAALPWEQPEHESDGLSGLAAERSPGWVDWRQLRPRRLAQRRTTADGMAEEGSAEWRVVAVGAQEGGERAALVQAGLLARGGAETESGELGLAVESGGPLGQMRYAAPARSGGGGVGAAGHGQPGRRWVALRGSDCVVPSPLAPALTQLLAEIQRPPALPTLRRNLDSLRFYYQPSGAGGRVLLLLGYRERGRGRTQRDADAGPARTAPTHAALRVLERRLALLGVAATVGVLRGPSALLASAGPP